MHKITHEFDVYNPAEFFASLGILTAFALQYPQADIRSHFVISAHRGETNAALVISSDVPLYLEKAMSELRTANLTEDKTANVWKNPGLNPKLFSPVIITTASWSITLDWWLDELRMEANDLKFWAGNSTPVDMLMSFIKLGTDFANAGGSVFGFDTRSSRDALTVGYSKRDTGEKAGLYPMTELLCAIGLQQYRPSNFTYYAWRETIPVNITHAAAILEIPGLRQSRYKFQVQKISQGAAQVFPAADISLAASAS